VNKVSRLVKSYSRFIAVPWREDAAPAQRVVFCVYDEKDELRLRARIDEFEIATKQAGHDWVLFDLTDTFPKWLSGQRYVRSYFQKPHLLASLLPKYLEYLTTEFDAFLKSNQVGPNSVAALIGVGSLFGLLKVKELVERFAPRVPGRLLLLFPGSYENNNYRLLDAYDGWNYLAVPITADREA
jgi:hypothetical protein